MSKLVTRRTVALAIPIVILIAVLALAACGSPSYGSGATAPTATAAVITSPTAEPTSGTGSTANQVNVSNFQFSPSTLTIKVGTTVTWKGISGSHTVTSDDSAPMKFDQPISEGGTVTVTFAQAGTYEYHCSIHASMHAKIIVTA